MFHRLMTPPKIPSDYTAPTPTPQPWFTFDLLQRKKYVSSPKDLDHLLGPPPFQRVPLALYLDAKQLGLEFYGLSPLSSELAMSASLSTLSLILHVLYTIFHGENICYTGQ
jgi:hypothetical protein